MQHRAPWASSEAVSRAGFAIPEMLDNSCHDVFNLVFTVWFVPLDLATGLILNSSEFPHTNGKLR